MRPLSEIVISERRGRNARRVLVADLQCSWEVSRAGSLGCRIPVADLVKAGWTQPALGAWVRYDHPTAGAWGGVVTNATYADGILEIGAQSFHILTRKRLVKTGELDDAPVSGTPGNLYKKLFALADTGYDGVDRIALGRGTVNTSAGPQLELSFVDDDFYETVIPAITTDVAAGPQGTWEWHVDADRQIDFGPSRPATVGQTRRMREGIEIASARWSADLWPVANVIVAYGIIKRYDKKRDKEVRFREQAIAVNPESIARYGALIETRSYPQTFASVGALQNAARAAVGIAANPPAAAELTLVDHNDAFAAFREGDWIGVDLPLSGLTGQVRVMIRALDVSAGTMIVTGEGWQS